MQTYIQTFTGSQTWTLHVPGKYFTTLQCANPVNVRFYLGGKQLDLGQISQLLAGLEVTLGEIDDPRAAFDRIEVDVTGPDTVAVGIGNGQARYNRSAGSVAITNTAGGFTQAAATVTNASAQLVAAKANRRYLLIQNKSATGTVYLNLSGAAATVANGVRIGPGDALEVSTYSPTAAVFAIGDIASNPDVVVVEG